MFCVGLDRAENQLAKAKRNNDFKNGLTFMHFNVTPNTIDQLPIFDVILLLTVYHHWVDAFGPKESEIMLTKLTEKSDKLFIQPPGREIKGIQKLESRSIVDYYQSYFNEITDTQVKYIATTNYKGGNRRDPLFLINSQEI